MSKAAPFTDAPENKGALTVIKKDDVESTKLALNSYFSEGIQVMDFNDIPLPVRLSFIQKTPVAFRKTRRVGGTEIPYIDHYFAEKCLNFVSNFQWGSKIVRSDIQEVMVDTRNGKKKSFDAMVEMDFWIELGGKRIERFIVSGHRMFENPATTRADALKSAVSKANTVFARQFGVGTNIIDDEGKAYNRIVETMDKVSPVQIKEAKFQEDDFAAPKKTVTKIEDVKKAMEKAAPKKEKTGDEKTVEAVGQPHKMFDLEKFVIEIGDCKTFEDLNGMNVAFGVVSKLEGQGGLTDEQVKTTFDALTKKLTQFKPGQEEEKVVTAHDLHTLFKTNEK